MKVLHYLFIKINHTLYEFNLKILKFTDLLLLIGSTCSLRSSENNLFLNLFLCFSFQ